jgi:hypothetical protein
MCCVCASVPLVAGVHPARAAVSARHATFIAAGLALGLGPSAHGQQRQHESCAGSSSGQHPHSNIISSSQANKPSCSGSAQHATLSVSFAAALCVRLACQGWLGRQHTIPDTTAQLAWAAPLPHWHSCCSSNAPWAHCHLRPRRRAGAAVFGVRRRSSATATRVCVRLGPGNGSACCC